MFPSQKSNPAPPPWWAQRMASLRNANVMLPLSAVALILSVGLVPSHAQFTGFANKGLVGVGRLSGNTFDALGPNVDTLGGIFSGMAFEVGSWERTGDAVAGFTYRGRLLCVPDRNLATVDFHPR